jgi:hypothetical protein
MGYQYLLWGVKMGIIAAENWRSLSMKIRKLTRRKLGTTAEKCRYGVLV